MANLRSNNLTGTGGRNAIDGSVLLQSNPKSRISVTNTTGLDFGTDQFTIEFWIYLLKEAPVNKNIFARSTSNSGTTGMIMWFDGNGHLEFDSAHGATGAVHTGAAIATHTWHHIAVTRDSSNNTRLYLNGVNKASASNDTTNIVGATNLEIASNIGTDAYYNDAYISNFRMVKGTAVYSGTTDFTPPTEKLTAIDGTILLCCQDSDNPLQEATGKTITGYGNLNVLTTDVNLVTNGHFNTDISGWTVVQGAAQWTAGQAELTSPATTMRQTLTTVVGQRYRMQGTADSTGNTSNNIGITLGSRMTYVPSDTFRPAAKTFTADWTATSTSTVAEFWGGTDGTGKWSNIVVKLLDPPEQINEIPSVGVDEGVTFEGDTKVNSQSYMYFPTGDTSQRSRGRGILFGGGSPGRTDRIDYIDIPSGGNSIDFGNLACGNVWGSGAGASSTRGVFWGGENQYTKLDYVTIATTGNATSFGTSSNNSNQGTCMSSETRAVFVLTGGNIMEYVTIASTGNTTDFGDHNDGALTAAAGLASPTRGIVSGGYGPSPYPQSNTIQYITIATTGNASDFGDLTFGHSGHFGVSNTTRGVFAKGYTFPSPTTTYYNTIEYITIASTGNATDFGDATNSVTQGYSHASHTRGVFAGGTAASDVNTIDYITIATTGNAADFGDTHSATRGGSGTSDCHGGIS